MLVASILEIFFYNNASDKYSNHPIPPTHTYTHIVYPPPAPKDGISGLLKHEVGVGGREGRRQTISHICATFSIEQHYCQSVFSCRYLDEHSLSQIVGL